MRDQPPLIAYIETHQSTANLSEPVCFIGSGFLYT